MFCSSDYNERELVNRKSDVKRDHFSFHNRVNIDIFAIEISYWIWICLAGYGLNKNQRDTARRHMQHSHCSVAMELPPFSCHPPDPLYPWQIAIKKLSSIMFRLLFFCLNNWKIEKILPSPRCRKSLFNTIFSLQHFLDLCIPPSPLECFFAFFQYIFALASINC